MKVTGNLLRICYVLLSIDSHLQSFFSIDTQLVDTPKKDAKP